MTLPVRLRIEAEKDIEDAARWYEEQQRGLVEQFLDEIISTFASVAKQPAMYPVVGREAHRALTHRFPFGVYYLIEKFAVVVIAGLHGSRHPLHWKSRT